MTQINPVEILLLPVEGGRSGADTFARYLNAISQRVFDDGEDFNPEQPFGNESPEAPLIHALILHKLLDGELDDEGNVTGFDWREFYSILAKVYEYLDNADYGTLQPIPQPKEYAIIQLSTSGIDPRVVGYAGDLFTKEEAESYRDRALSNSNTLEWVIVKVR